MLFHFIRDKLGKACSVCLLSLCFSFFLLSQSAPPMATAAVAHIYQNAEVNRLLDENYQQVQEHGYAKLFLPSSLHGLTDKDLGHLHPIPIQQDVHGRKSSEVR